MNSKPAPKIQKVTHAPGRARGGLAWLAGFVLLLQLGGLAHVALVRHEVCWEHGEYTDAAPSEAPVGAKSVRSLPEDATTGIQTAAAAITAAEHDHCATLSHRRDLRPIFAPALQALPTPAALRPVLGVSGRYTSVGALFRLVPKQSPPA